VIPGGSLKYRYEFLVPLHDNEGNPFDPAEIVQVRDEITEKFGSLHFQPSAPYYGPWEHKGVVYEDKLLLFIVDGPPEETDVQWFQAYKEELKGRFRQLEIYLVAYEVYWL